MMKKSALLFICIICAICNVIAQEKNNVDEIYSNALKLYEEQKISDAVTELERVITLNPRHKDALFNLAVINFDLGNTNKGIDLLQACVRLRDRDAAELLKGQFQQRIALADTMDIEDVDIKAKVNVGSVQEELIVNSNLNKAIEQPLVEGIRKSKILRKDYPAGKLLVLSLYVEKDGKLNGMVIGTIKSEAIQKEVSSILSTIDALSPSKHEGQAVVTWGLTLPIRM